MGWLSGWAKRIELTSDHTKVDSTLTHFAITAFLKAGNGDTVKVFEAGGVGASYLKTAIADDAGNQFYVEVEQWDSTAKVGVIHFGRTGSTYDLPSASAKKYYLYYDAAHADNTDFVGVTQSTPAKLVWDSNFRARYDKKDKTTSTIEDSTADARHGTKGAANNPLEVDAKIAKGQRYDGNDYIDLGTGLNDLGSQLAEVTVSCWAKSSASTSRQALVATANTGSVTLLNLEFRSSADFPAFTIRNEAGTIKAAYGSSSITDGAWYHVVGVHSVSGEYTKLYIDGVEVASTDHVPNNFANFSYKLPIGALNNRGTYANFVDGDIDEVRISKVAYSPARVKAEFNSLNDSLLTYGSEETCIPFRSIYPHILIR